MNEIHIEIPVNGGKNAIVKAFGLLTSAHSKEILVLFTELRCEKLKIESLTFAIQEKLGFRLWWRIGEDACPILPLESRGYLNWAAGGQSLQSPAGADAILFEAFGWAEPDKSFMFIMDIEKQR